MSSADGSNVIERGERVRLTFDGDTEVGVHASGRTVYCSLSEIVGSEILFNGEGLQ